MIAVNSTMAHLGMDAPDFRLPDASKKYVTRDHFRNAPVMLVVFWCGHCPFVRHIRRDFARLAREYQAKGVAVVAINPNASTVPADAPDKMLEEIRLMGYTFPYLVDAKQTVARAYQAVCTPDFFVFDAKRHLVYRGQMDGSRPGNDTPITGKDLRAALDAALEGHEPAEEQKPSIGCSIKWAEES